MRGTDVKPARNFRRFWKFPKRPLLQPMVATARYCAALFHTMRYCVQMCADRMFEVFALVFFITRLVLCASSALCGFCAAAMRVLCGYPVLYSAVTLRVLCGYYVVLWYLRSYPYAVWSAVVESHRFFTWNTAAGVCVALLSVLLVLQMYGSHHPPRSPPA